MFDKLGKALVAIGRSAGIHGDPMSVEDKIKDFMHAIASWDAEIARLKRLARSPGSAKQLAEAKRSRAFDVAKLKALLASAGIHGDPSLGHIGIEYGDMSMSTFGDPPGRHQRLHFGNEPALIGPHATAFGADRFGLGVIIPSTATRPSAATVPTPPPQDDGSSQMNGEYEDYGAGDQGESPETYLSPDNSGIDPFANAHFGFEQYEQHEGTAAAHRYTPGAFGFEQYEQHEGDEEAHRYTPGAFGVEPALIGPHATSFGEEYDPPGLIDLLPENDGENMSFQPVGPDAWDTPEEVPTQRNPITRFGGEFYPSFGPAPLLAGEGSSVGCDLEQTGILIGCD